MDDDQDPQENGKRLDLGIIFLICAPYTAFGLHWWLEAALLVAGGLAMILTSLDEMLPAKRQRPPNLVQHFNAALVERRRLRPRD